MPDKGSLMLAEYFAIACNHVNGHSKDETLVQELTAMNSVTCSADTV